MRLREKFAAFMTGRNGNDYLNRFLLVTTVVFLLLAALIKKSFGNLFYFAALALLAFVYFRMFSRNLPKRRAENERYLAKRYKVVNALRVEVQKWKQRKEYKFFKCPSCSSVLRVPRGKGKIKIVCRKCGRTFEGKT